MPVVAVPLSAGANSYLGVGPADELAVSLPDLASWNAASAAAKAAALNQASADVDAAMPYQGRPYDPAQPLQFPRVAEDPAPGARPGAPDGTVPGAVVWDWDAATNAPVVPREVKLATLFQADAILSGSREPRLSAQHDGVTYEVTGSLAESYRQTRGPGVGTGLCRKAWVLVRQYRLRSGRLL